MCTHKAPQDASSILMYDVTINLHYGYYDEVTTLVGVNILSLEPHPSFKRIRILRSHFEQALQYLPYPQSTLHG
jgi:hypothetical protein